MQKAVKPKSKSIPNARTMGLELCCAGNRVSLCNSAAIATILRKSMMTWFRSTASKSTPARVPAPSLPLPDVESYKILDHLHLGLNVKIGATYSRQELEARCKGNEPRCNCLAVYSCCPAHFNRKVRYLQCPFLLWRSARVQCVVWWRKDARDGICE